jgi:glycine/D-amino acid oxidase-like deaminating enzyme
MPLRAPSRNARASLVIVALGAFTPRAAAQMLDPGDVTPSPGFSLCVAPLPPPCVETTKKIKPGSVCDQNVKAYIGAMFQYRECHNQEVERAVRESNDVIDRWKCRQGLEGCRR